MTFYVHTVKEMKKKPIMHIYKLIKTKAEFDFFEINNIEDIYVDIWISSIEE